MARLPIPGSDQGSWGNILNDYLSQSLNADGTIKNAVIGAGQIADNAITSAKIADGSISAAKLAVDVTNTRSDIRSFQIFYAPPNTMNGKYSDDYAAASLARYDDVVLGTGLEDPGNTYYTSTKNIIQKLAGLSPNTVVWGYVNTGVTTGNLSLATLQMQIDQWITIGAKGIFLDTFGYDYQVPRSRQTSILNYIHSKNIGAIINVWNADDALSANVDATYNPTGAPTAANSNDILLLESWICNSDTYASPYYATISDVKTRGDKAVAYRNSLGIRIYAANTMLHTGTSDATIDNYRGVSEGLARAWRLDGTGLSASTYSSTGSDSGIIRPRFSQYRDIELRKSGPYILNGGWTSIEAPDLGITINYDPGTSTFNWQQI